VCQSCVCACLCEMCECVVVVLVPFCGEMLLSCFVSVLCFLFGGRVCFFFLCCLSS